LASTAIEEDLDAALDDILGDAIQEAEYPAGMQTGSHLPETHSIPQNLVEEVRYSTAATSLGTVTGRT
jgi:hypothetical protein